MACLLADACMRAQHTFLAMSAWPPASRTHGVSTTTEYIFHVYGHVSLNEHTLKSKACLFLYAISLKITYLIVLSIDPGVESIGWWNLLGLYLRNAIFLFHKKGRHLIFHQRIVRVACM